MRCLDNKLQLGCLDCMKRGLGISNRSDRNSGNMYWTEKRLQIFVSMVLVVVSVGVRKKHFGYQASFANFFPQITK